MALRFINTPDENAQFYSTFPSFGKNIAFQWDEIREDLRLLNPLVRATLYENESSQPLQDSAVTASEFGEFDFHNKYRIFWDKALFELKVQKNTNTEEAPIWVNHLVFGSSSDGTLILKDIRGVVTEVGETGFGGDTSFYNVNRILFDVGSGFYLTASLGGDPVVNFDQLFGRAKSFAQTTPAVEWNINHNFGTTKLQVQVFDDNHNVIMATADRTGKFEQVTNAAEWTIVHDLNTRNIIADAYDETGGIRLTDSPHLKRFVVQNASTVNFYFDQPRRGFALLNGLSDGIDSIDVSDPNTTNFYFSSPRIGSAMISSGAQGIEEFLVNIVVSDGVNSVTTTQINFAGDINSGSKFYITNNALGQAVVNLERLDPVILTEKAIEPPTPSIGDSALFMGSDQGFPVPRIKHDDSIVRELHRDLIHIARNTTGSTIPFGSIVYITSATGQVPNIALAQADSSTTMPGWGVTSEAIDNNAFGRVIVGGDQGDLDTSAFVQGDLVYVSETVAGALTATEPNHPNLHQEFATVVRANAGGGILKIHPRHADGDDFGTQQTSFTVGTTAAAAFTLDSTGVTGARNFTFADRSGQLALVDELGFYNTLFKLSDDSFSEKDDTLVFDVADFAMIQNGAGKPQVSVTAGAGSSITFQESGIGKQAWLSNLFKLDDTFFYVTASSGDGRPLISLSSAPGGGISNITFQETGTGKQDWTSTEFHFDDAFFYITASGGDGLPIVSLTSAPGGGDFLALDGSTSMTGTILARPDSALAGPNLALAPSDGTNTGIMFDAANRMQFVVNGTEIGELLTSGTAWSTNFTSAGNLQGVFVICTSRFQAASGTASIPSITFSAGSGEGVYRPAIRKLGLAAGAVEHIRLNRELTDTDHVNIGERLGVNLTDLDTIPSATVHVQGDGLFENGKVSAAGFYLLSGGELTPGGAAKSAEAFGSSVEWVFTHNKGTSDLVWSAYDDALEAVIPRKVDVSDINTTYFYFTTAVAGRAVVVG